MHPAPFTWPHWCSLISNIYTYIHHAHFSWPLIGECVSTLQDICVSLGIWWSGWTGAVSRQHDVRAEQKHDFKQINYFYKQSPMTAEFTYIWRHLRVCVCVLYTQDTFSPVYIYKPFHPFRYRMCNSAGLITFAKMLLFYHLETGHCYIVVLHAFI